MHLSLLILSLAPLALTRPIQTVVACLDFTGYVSTQGFISDNGTYIALNYTVVASLR